MSRKRQKIQLLLAFAVEGRDELPMAAAEGTERPMASEEVQSPTHEASLMEEVCQQDNLWKALKRVQANKGAPGVDGMTVRQLRKYLKRHWPKIRDQLLAGTYRPQPVKRVEIPKPDGGVRKLGIPTALDRFIQQAVLQVLQERWDHTFSEQSYGFRPGRSADLRGANLAGANLRDADLRRVIFCGAHLDGARLTPGAVRGPGHILCALTSDEWNIVREARAHEPLRSRLNETMVNFAAGRSAGADSCESTTPAKGDLP